MTVGDVVSTILVYAIYGACGLTAIMLALVGRMMGRWEIQDARWMHRRELEADWPQYVIQEAP